MFDTLKMRFFAYFLKEYTFMIVEGNDYQRIETLDVYPETKTIICSKE